MSIIVNMAWNQNSNTFMYQGMGGPGRGTIIGQNITQSNEKAPLITPGMALGVQQNMSMGMVPMQVRGPGTGSPRMASPGMGGPGIDPRMASPGAGSPRMASPGTGSPRMGGPGMGGPVMGGSGMGGPGMGGSGINLGMGGPGIGSPRMGGPGMGGPGTGTGTGSPSMGGPGMGGSGINLRMGSPRTGSPTMGGPAMGSPGMGISGMGSPSMGGLGMGGSGINPEMVGPEAGHGMGAYGTGSFNMGGTGMGSLKVGGLGIGASGINPGVGANDTGHGMGGSRISSGNVGPWMTFGTGVAGTKAGAEGPGTVGTSMGHQPPSLSINPFMQAPNIQSPKSIQKMSWSFLHDNGKFIEYDDMASSLIENAYSTNMPSVELLITGQTYIINFRHPFSQTLKEGKGIEREVRRNDGTSQPILERGQAKWLWKDDYGIFNEYEPKASLLIERAYQGNRNNVIVCGTNGKAYFITLNQNNFFQKNEITNFPREIIRRIN